LAQLRAQADEVRRDLAERQANAGHEEIMAATQVPLPAVPSVIYKQYEGDQLDDTDTNNGDVEPPMFSDEQIDTLATVISEIKMELQDRIDDAVAPLAQRLAVVEGQLSLLTALLSNNKSLEAIETIRKIRVAS
jgi:hypothetical protein